ncbi:transposase [Streptomyces sp. NPDC002520]
MEILGVDDFAFRKGRHYGTILIDMATHRPLHLYDGRKGEDLAAWLRDQPEVRVMPGPFQRTFAKSSGTPEPQASPQRSPDQPGHRPLSAGSRTAG